MIHIFLSSLLISAFFFFVTAWLKRKKGKVGLDLFHGLSYGLTKVGTSVTRREAAWATGKRKDGTRFIFYFIELCWFKMLVQLRLPFPATAVPPTYVPKRPHPPLAVFMCRSNLVPKVRREGP